MTVIIHQSTIMPSVIMLSVAFYLLLCEFHDVKCRYDECRYGECRGVPAEYAHSLLSNCSLILPVPTVHRPNYSDRTLTPDLGMMRREF